MVKFTDYGGLFSYMETYHVIDLLEDLRASAADTMELADLMDPRHFMGELTQIMENLHEMCAILNELNTRKEEDDEDPAVFGNV